MLFFKHFPIFYLVFLTEPIEVQSQASLRADLHLPYSVGSQKGQGYC